MTKILLETVITVAVRKAAGSVPAGAVETDISGHLRRYLNTWMSVYERVCLLCLLTMRANPVRRRRASLPLCSKQVTLCRGKCELA